MGSICLPEPERLARLTASILSTKVCNEDRDGSPLAVMGEDGRYTQVGIGCRDSWFYNEFSSLKNWHPYTSTPASTTTTTTTSTPASTTTTTTTSAPDLVNQPQQTSPGTDIRNVLFCNKYSFLLFQTDQPLTYQNINWVAFQAF